MDDFDEVDEQNEEDLLLLGDEFAKIPNLKQHLLDQFDKFADENLYKQGRDYLKYCIKQLHEDDHKLAQLYLSPIINKHKQH